LKKENSFLGRAFVKIGVLFLGALLLLGGTGGSLFAEEVLRDLRRIPQHPVHYLPRECDVPLVSPEEQARNYENFRKRYFAPWDKDCGVTEEDLLWPFEWLEKRTLFGENLRPRESSWLEKQRRNARLSGAGELALPGITVQETDLRLFPTREPAFYDPALAGEGYPFDYLQNSTLKPLEPILLSHASEDGAWIYVKGSFASGWVDIRHVARVAPEMCALWKSMPQVVVVREKTSLKSAEGNFVALAKTGTLLPLVRKPLPGQDFTVLGARRNASGEAVFSEGSLSREEGDLMPLAFTGWNAMRILEELQGELYGWGGLVQNRDCSATVRDFFIPFGLWLPRNSRYQAKTGRIIDVGDLQPQEKEALLLEKGEPFRTLVGIPGHIMLYVGAYGKIPVVFHNTWGIKTLQDDREGRHIIGRALFTSLWAGEKLRYRYPGKTLLIHRITSFAFPWEMQ